MLPHARAMNEDDTDPSCQCPAEVAVVNQGQETAPLLLGAPPGRPAGEQAGGPGGQGVGPPLVRDRRCAALLWSLGTIAALSTLADVALAAGTGASFAVSGGPSEWVKSLEDVIASAGPVGYLYYTLAYVLAAVLFVPGSLLTVAAGFLFGPLTGTAVVSVASTLAAATAFLIARYLARPQVLKRLEGNRRFNAIDAAIGREGAKVVFLLRLSPLLPFSLSNYMYGLTSVDFGSYVLSSWAGMLPGTFAYVYVGGAGRSTLEGPSLLQGALTVVGVIATFAGVALVSKQASKFLEESSAGLLSEQDVSEDVADNDAGTSKQ